MSLVPKANVIGGNRLPQVVLRPPHMCGGTHACRRVCTQPINEKYKPRVFTRSQIAFKMFWHIWASPLAACQRRYWLEAFRMNVGAAVCYVATILLASLGVGWAASGWLKRGMRCTWLEGIYIPGRKYIHPHLWCTCQPSSDWIPTYETCKISNSK